MTGTTGGSALWTQSIYPNEFVKQGGVWKFKAMRVYPRFIVDAEKGWAKDAQSAPGPSREFPPIGLRPRHTRSIPAFTLRRSTSIIVTGRPPQYPEGNRQGRVAERRDKSALVSAARSGRAADTIPATAAAGSRRPRW